MQEWWFLPLISLLPSLLEPYKSKRNLLFIYFLFKWDSLDFLGFFYITKLFRIVSKSETLVILKKLHKKLHCNFIENERIANYFHQVYGKIHRMLLLLICFCLFFCVFFFKLVADGSILDFLTAGFFTLGTN